MAASLVRPKLVGQRIKRREDPRLIQGRATYVDDIKVVGMQHLAVVRSDIAQGRILSIGTSAADAIVVDYEQLPAVVDPEQAMTGTPVVIHADFADNLALPFLPGGTGVAAGFTVDDTVVDQAFADAEVVVSQRMVNQRLAPTPIETRGVLAHFEPGKGTMTIWSSTQNPHTLRTFIATMIGLGQDQVRAIAPEVGGGFGAKIDIYPEEYVAAALSKHLGLPI